jgi:amino acid adenylation domain-containing protein
MDEQRAAGAGLGGVAERNDVSEQDAAPLTPPQRRLWLLDRLQPACSAYSMPYALEIEGPLDELALCDSLAALVRRHDALRTEVFERDGEAYTRVVAHACCATEVVDVTDGYDALERLMHAEVLRPFDLTRAPLFRAKLYRLAAHRHVLFFNISHLVCDGWSIEVLLRELRALYALRRDGAGSPPPPLARSFSQCARREVELACGPLFEDALARTVERLRDIEPLDFPADRLRPALFRYAGAACDLVLSAQRVAAIRNLARAQGTTPQIVLLGAYILLLSRYSGQTDLTIGCPIAGRDQTELEAVVGFFARTLVVRTRVDPDESFADWLDEVREACFAAYEDELAPFERVVERLNPPRDRSRTPLFQALFSLQQIESRAALFAGARCVQRRLPAQGAKTDLTLLFEDDGSTVVGRLEYNIDLFAPETMARFVRNYLTLLDNVLADPERAVSRIGIVHGDELAQLERTHRGADAARRELAFVEIFAEQVRRTPDRVALIDQHGGLTYRELDASSDRWAARLRAENLGAGGRLGVALGRSRRMLEVTLGIWKVGAAYVPLDPTFPPARLAYMLEDSAVACIVSEQAFAHAFVMPGRRFLLAEQVEREPLPTSAPRTCGGADELAYIIYTSGSTGRPKGVEVTQSGLVNLLASMAREPGCGPDDRVLAVSTFSFDMCIAELYLPLTVGARTIIAPRTCAADGALLSQYIDRYGATLVQATPTTFHLLVQAGLPRQRFKAIAGGEVLSSSLARALGAACPEVWNGYGPTETTVYATFQRVIDSEAPVLIGQPVANVSLYVLDEHLQRVPFGVTGELYIGGAGVSRGYCNQPELTRMRFFSDRAPFATNERVYRTGDLVKMRPEGLEYVGRRDHQIKLRGYRIELGEIESALASHPAVRRAVVVVRPFGSDDRRLVAYVATGGEVIAPEILRSFLRSLLPAYMVPPHLVLMAELPLTQSGKVDRNRLPEPLCELFVDAKLGPSAEGELERVLLDLWKQVLGRSGIGPNDDFFALGGHSLLAVRLVHEINRALHTRLSLSVVFDSPTVREQAARIDCGEHGGGVSIVPLREGGNAEPLFCICGINLYQALARRLPADRPVYGLFLPIEERLFEQGAIELNVQEMARSYCAAVRSLQATGPYFLAGISFGGALAFEIARQLRAEGEAIGLLAALDTILPSARREALVPGPAMHALRAVAAGARAARAWIERTTGGTSQRARADSDELTRSLSHTRMLGYQRALASYDRHVRTYDGDLVLVRARRTAGIGLKYAADYGFRRHVRGRLIRLEHGGQHLDMLAEPGVAELAQLLAPFLCNQVATRPRGMAAASQRGP